MVRGARMPMLLSDFVLFSCLTAFVAGLVIAARLCSFSRIAAFCSAVWQECCGQSRRQSRRQLLANAAIAASR
jgi:hypothetical protein